MVCESLVVGGRIGGGMGGFQKAASVGMLQTAATLGPFFVALNITTSQVAWYIEAQSGLTFILRRLQFKHPLRDLR